MTKETVPHQVLQTLSTVTGTLFFDNLASHMQEAFAVESVHIALFSDTSRKHLETAYCNSPHGDIPHHPYPTNNTFCECLLDKSLFVCKENAKDLYPDNQLLQTMQASSCIAVILRDEDNLVCGSFAAFGKKPFKLSHQLKTLMQFFAARVSSETRAQQKKERLIKEAWFNQTALDSIPIPIFFNDDTGACTRWNQAFDTYLDPAGTKDMSWLAPAQEDPPEKDQPQTFETSMMNRHGKRRTLLVHKSGMSKEDGSFVGSAGAMIDVTDLRRAESMIDYLAHFDTLTQLPNQVLFHDRLTNEIAHAIRNHETFAVFVLDLDNFKKINNVYGHNVGDSLLIEVAKRLQHTIREDDTVARMGGDSFTLLLKSISYEEDAAIIATKIQNALNQPYLLGDREVFITASIGIALFPLDGNSAQDLIKHGDAALHKAKEDGRSTHTFFTSAMNTRATEQLDLENSLRRALEREEFVLYYQPQYTTKTYQMIGVEALIRWNHPGLGMISPDKFIPLAEHTGLIVPIGEWVLRTACLQMKAWQDAKMPTVRISVNLSPRQFQQPDLCEKIERILAETGVNARSLSLEITESVVMQDVEYAVSILNNLKTIGIHLSIDDFGTGYSSLGYLKRFPIDMLKIDRSFIMEIPHAQDDIAIVSAVVAMAHSLNIKVIAEGVETIEQKDFLNSVNCDELQGFFFSKPIAPEKLSRLPAVLN